MANATIKNLVIGTPVKGKITSALSRGKAFVVFIEDYAQPIIIAKRNAIEDGYVHKSQLVGVTITANPTQATNGDQPGFLATVDMPEAPNSSSRLVINRQAAADKYMMAALYAVPLADAV